MDKPVFVLTQDNIASKANDIYKVLINTSRSSPISSGELAEKVGLKESQLHTVIKYMRRSSEKDFEEYIQYYPISTKKGYFFPKTAEDFVPYYITMRAWYLSLQRTVDPARKMILEAGIDLSTYETEKTNDVHNYLDDIPEMDKHSSWFMESDDE